MADGSQQIVTGITVSKSGEATVDPALADVLFDLALRLEETTKLPVDVQHVLAAIVLAARHGELQADSTLFSGDPKLEGVLLPHVKTVFRQFNGKLGHED